MGGKPGTGGTGTGGTTSTGGTTGTGGTTSIGGSSGNANPSGLPLPPGAGGMAKPSGTPSTITVLNWAGFKGAVSYTLDDDNSSQISNYSMLQAQGIPYTFYMWGNRTEASNAVWAAGRQGRERDRKPHLEPLEQRHRRASDINQDTTFIMQHLSVTPYTMAAPNGASVYTQLANGLFMINRGVSDAIIKPNDNTDRFTLPCYIPATGAPASSFNSEVDSAQSAGGWRVILVHGFTGGTDSAYQPVGISDYLAGIQHTKSLGNMWIGTGRRRGRVLAGTEGVRVGDHHDLREQQDLDLDQAEQLPPRQVPAGDGRRRHADPGRAGAALERPRLLRDRARRRLGHARAVVELGPL